MNNVVLIAMFLLTSITLIASNSFAANFVYDDVNIQIKDLAVGSAGIDFTVIKRKKNKTVIIAPNSSCENTFNVSPDTDEYNVIAAFLLSAKMNKKKIGIEYDETFTGCAVPVISVTIK